MALDFLQDCKKNPPQRKMFSSPLIKANIFKAIHAKFLRNFIEKNMGDTKITIKKINLALKDAYPDLIFKSQL
jgi:hypothetical protein